MKINRLEIPNMVRAYTVDLVPVIELARRYGITRSGVYSALHAAGVSTRHQDAAHIKTFCDNPACGREIDVIRSVYRKQLLNFCSSECYHFWLKEEQSKNPIAPSRQGIRIAKRVIEQTGFFVQYGMAIYHEDKNQANNETHNLRVFGSHLERATYARGGSAIPIWDGRDYQNKPSPETKRKGRHIAATL